MCDRVTEIWMSVARVALLTGRSEKTVRRLATTGHYESRKVSLTTRRGQTRKTFIRATDELRETELRTRMDRGFREADVLKVEEGGGEEPLVRYYLSDEEVPYET